MNYDSYAFLLENLVRGTYTHGQITKQSDSTVKLSSRQILHDVLTNMRTFGEENSRRVERVNRRRYFGTPLVIDESGESIHVYKRLLDESSDVEKKTRYASVAATLLFESAVRQKRGEKATELLIAEQATEALNLFKSFHGVNLPKECKQKTQLREHASELNQIECQLVIADSKHKVNLVKELLNLSGQLCNWPKPSESEKSRYQNWLVSRAIASDIHFRTIELALEVDQDDIAKEVLLLPHFDPRGTGPRPITLTLAAFQATDCPAHDTAAEVQRKQVANRVRLSELFGPHNLSMIG